MLSGMDAPAGDEMHYSDGSHRWVPANPSVSVEAWRAKVSAHVEEAERAGGCDQVVKPGLPQRVPQKRNGGPRIPMQRQR